jgi:erythronate-4-phosphate dehydrogenase
VGPDTIAPSITYEKLKNTLNGSDPFPVTAKVVDNSALLNLLKKGKELFVVLDVWENEPMINAELLRNVFIGTPHIAGYSYEGKVNATSMIYNAFLDCAAQCGFEIPTDKWTPPKMELKNNIITVAERETEKILSEIFERVYPIVEDDKRLRKLLNLSSSERAEYFDSLRNTYAFRRELKNYFVRGDLTPEAEKAIALCGGIVNQQKEK